LPPLVRVTNFIKKFKYSPDLHGIQLLYIFVHAFKKYFVFSIITFKEAQQLL